jgi:WD40 repeat protein
VVTCNLIIIGMWLNKSFHAISTNNIDKFLSTCSCAITDEITAHSQKVTCLDLGETGRVLVTGGQDRNVNLWAFGNDKCFMVYSQ